MFVPVLVLVKVVLKAAIRVDHTRGRRHQGPSILRRLRVVRVGGVGSEPLAERGLVLLVSLQNLKKVRPKITYLNRELLVLGGSPCSPVVLPDASALTAIALEAP